MAGKHGRCLKISPLADGIHMSTNLRSRGCEWTLTALCKVQITGDRCCPVCNKRFVDKASKVGQIICHCWNSLLLMEKNVLSQIKRSHKMIRANDWIFVSRCPKRIPEESDGKCFDDYDTDCAGQCGKSLCRVPERDMRSLHMQGDACEDLCSLFGNYHHEYTDYLTLCKIITNII